MKYEPGKTILTCARCGTFIHPKENRIRDPKTLKYTNLFKCHKCNHEGQVVVKPLPNQPVAAPDDMEVLTKLGYREGANVLRCIACDRYIHPRTHRLKDNITKKYVDKWKCYKCKWVGFPKIDKKKHDYDFSPRPTPSDKDFVKCDRDFIIKKLDMFTSDPYTLRIKDYKVAAFISLLFLTAARISEIVGVKDKTGGYLVPPITYSQIGIAEFKGNKVFYCKDMPVLKRRVKATVIDRYKLRSVKIPEDHEKQLIAHVMKYYTLIKPYNDDGTETILFDFSTVYGWEACKKVVGIYPHLIRHGRTTDLVQRYNFRDIQLMHFLGWANTAMAARYAHLTSDDLTTMMINNYQDKIDLTVPEDNQNSMNSSSANL